MKMSGAMLNAVLALGLGLGSLAFGEENIRDASAMTAAVHSSKGAMIRVPVDNQGRELTEQAQLKVVNDVIVQGDESRLPEVWNQGTDVTNAPIADSSTSGDSSTRGHFFWGWNAWRWANVGWYAPYYYYGYWPTYYYNGYTYGYGSPYYYNYYNPYYYGGYPTWGYRYYYYPAGW